MSHQHDHQHDGHDCCGHDHHDHAAEAKAHDHTHDHAGCCGHDHHDHAVEKKEHDHAHDHHGCCGHDHLHDESSAHDAAEDAEWTRRFFVMLQAVVLIMIGGVMCYFVTMGRIDAYVTGWFRTLALCGGLGIMVMGIFNWLMRGKQASCGHDHGADECCDHEHDHGHGNDAPGAPPHHHEGSVLGRALTLLVLSGSVAAAAMLTPDRFSSRYLLNKADAYRGDSGSEQRRVENNPALVAARAAAEPATAQGGGGLTLAKIEQYVKRTKDGNFPLSVVNLHYMSGDPEYADVMDGQGIETTGQVVTDQVNPGPGHLRVVTMVVTCCAADARPYSIPIVFDGSVPDFVEMGWYEISGKLEFTRERGMKMALIKAKDLKATARPADQRPGM